MKLARLWQPSRAVWWLMVGFNLLSTACAWALRALPLTTTGTLLIGALGLANALCGLWLTARLLRGD
jgi:hypothetical protein